jgi:hypothetical protein
MDENAPNAKESKVSRTFLLVWALLASVAAVTFAVTTVLCLLYLSPGREGPANPGPNYGGPVLDPQDPTVPKPIVSRSRKDFWPGEAMENDYATSNAVGLVLGETELGAGLCLLETERDGLSELTTRNGKACRAMNPSERRRADPTASGYLYFVIHPSFKATAPGSYLVEVEYSGGPAGDFSLEYDAYSPRKTHSDVYTGAGLTVYLRAPNEWKTASFRVRNAAFENGQNGGADFRLVAKPPFLWVRRVTVKRAPPGPPGIGDAWPVDFSTSNQVSITLGEEKPQDGLRHNAEERDGLTTIVDLEGATCRQLNLAAEGKFFGSFYFAIAPSFKNAGLTNALVEVEYLAKRSNSFRIQFDGLQGGTNRSYVTVVPIGAQVVRRYGDSGHALTPTLGTWSVATFHLTNATFRNAQNGGADFRFEVIPPEMYVRRVIVRRENQGF